MIKDALLLPLALLFGCSASPHSLAGGGVSALAVHAVEWNPAHSDIGQVLAVADSGNDVVVFGPNTATVLSGGSIVAIDRSVKAWGSAATVPAADGTGTWIIGVDAEGQVRRLRNKTSFVPVSDRYGLVPDHVRAVAAMGGKIAAFDLGAEIAVADGAEVTRFAIAGARSSKAAFAAGGGRAALGGESLRVFDPKTKAVRAFALPSVSDGNGYVAVNAAGRLFVATSDAVYCENDKGELALRFEGSDIHGLVASGARIWFAAGTELGVVDGDAVLETSGAKLPKNATLVGSSSGDVWAIAGDALYRFASDERGGPNWDAAVGPVFKRSCSTCHMPDGEAGVDLSTQAQWVALRDRIKINVLVRKTMPPVGHDLADADRESLRGWLEGAAGVPVANKVVVAK